MERDFTAEVENELLEMADCYDLWLYAVPPDMENINAYQEYLDNWTDKEYAMEHIEQHKQYMIEEMLYTKDRITAVFQSVRDYDAAYKDTVSENADAFFHPYIDTMNALLEAIRVSGQGTPYISAELYAMAAREQLGQWGAFSGEYAGIFNNVSSFSDKIRQAGSGVVGETYQSLKEPMALQALLDKPANEIKPWEVAALSLIFDDCAGENGMVDCEALHALVNSCYTMERQPIGAGSMMGFSEEVTVTLAPVMGLLNEYRTAQSYQMAARYENNDIKLAFGLEIYDVQSYCYISDVIFALNTHCREYQTTLTPVQQCQGYEAYDTPVTLALSDDGTRMTMTFCGDENYNVAIYQFTQNFYMEAFGAQGEAAVAGIKAPNSQLMMDAVRFGVEQSVGLIPVLSTANTLYGLGTGAYDLYASYHQNLENNADCYWQADMAELQGVAYISGCSGSVVQCGNRYDIRNMALDGDNVIMQVALYNAAVEGGYQYPNGVAFAGEPIDSYTTVMHEFSAYISGAATLEQCPALNSLMDFDHGSHLRPELNDEHYTALMEQQLEALGAASTDPEQNSNSLVEAAAHNAAVLWLEGQ